jgi:hypothetical protein
MKNDPMDRASVALGTRVTPHLYKRMWGMARRKDWTLSHLIREALEKYVDKGKRVNGK